MRRTRAREHNTVVRQRIMAFGVFAMLAAACSCGDSVVLAGFASPFPVAGSYSQMAADGVAQLQTRYLPGSGVYGAPSGWWNAANSITVLVNYERAVNDTSYVPVILNTFNRAPAAEGHPDFINSYYDDDGWWALAWVDAYDLTGNASYLSMAETIFAAMAGGWDTACGGGIWWNTSRGYKNAIANELFLTVAAKLANRTKGSTSATYLSWAQDEWTWFKGSGMINAKSLINDGLNSKNPNACSNNGQTTWSYNQGVILGGLAELYKADRDPALMAQAQAIAVAAITNLTKNGILVDPTVNGGDAPQFKGVFMRNLMELYVAAPNPHTRRSSRQMRTVSGRTIRGSILNLAGCGKGHSIQPTRRARPRRWMRLWRRLWCSSGLAVAGLVPAIRANAPCAGYECCRVGLALERASGARWVLRSGGLGWIQVLRHLVL